MERRKKPKYNIGDTVVITIYGTVGKVTDVKWLDGVYVYEINQSDGFYKETILSLLSEYDGEIIEQEQIDIEYQFFIGDLVQVKGKGSDLYKIIGFRTEIWRSIDEAWEEVRYELARIDDGEWLEAGEEDLFLLAEAEDAEGFMEKLGILYSINQQQKIQKQSLEEKIEAAQDELQQEKLIDRLLDIYNDYQALYQWFGDEEYLLIMEAALRELKKLTSK